MGRPAHRPTDAPRTASPITRELIAIVEASGRTRIEVCKAAGVAHHALYRWGAGKNSASLVGFEALAQSLGYKLALVPLEPSE